MRNKFAKKTAIALLVFGTLRGTAQAACPNDPHTDIFTAVTSRTAKADAAAIRAALELLPRRPKCVAVSDVTENRPDVRDHLLTLDAFTVPGNDVVYIVQQSEVLALARSGASVASPMLASIIWHEMAHLRGEDERQARKAEQKIWQRFVRDGVVDALTALRYLKLLEQHAEDR